MKQLINIYLISCILLFIFPDTKSQKAEELFVRTRIMTHESGSSYQEVVSYFDSFGQNKQIVQKHFSPQGDNLITKTDYDGSGRIIRQHLPYPENNPGFYNDTHPYSKFVYEHSGLDRIKESFGPGMDWQKNDRSEKKYYLGNNAKNLKIKCDYYCLSGENVIKKGTYPQDELYVLVTKNERNKYMLEYTDKQGKLILRRQIIGTDTNRDTYYIYDDYGNLKYVLPPLAVSALRQDNTAWSIENNETLKNYAYYYKYDHKHQCIEKKITGSGKGVFRV